MTEDFLHYLWKYKLVAPNQVLTSGEEAVVVDPGVHNLDAGPDFINSRIRMEGALWVGNTEIHIRGSDWNRHGHDRDPAYSNVILHVVYHDDVTIRRPDGKPIPTLELQGKINSDLISVYRQLLLNRNWIPCSHLISYAGRLVIHGWLDRLLAERFERKAAYILNVLTACRNDWNEAFYRSLARSFGFNTNSIPFELLAGSLPYHVLSKHKDSLFQIEALLFGQAGMLSVSLRGTYFRELKEEYRFLSSKYGLLPMDGHLWKFLRMRPTNFPTIRIAQFAALVHGTSFLFSRMLDTEVLEALIKMLKVKASPYWDQHYSFRRRSKKAEKLLGDHAIHLILINTLIPFLYVYGKNRNIPRLKVRALMFLDQLPGEDNSIVRGWKRLGVGARSAYSTQALIELKTRYCQRKRCLECGIGNSLLKGYSGVGTN